MSEYLDRISAEWRERASDRILDLLLANALQLEAQGLLVKPRTICLDFDGVIHSHQPSWQGEVRWCWFRNSNLNSNLNFCVFGE